jgi:hypothetical protein
VQHTDNQHFNASKIFAILLPLILTMGLISCSEAYRIEEYQISEGVATLLQSSDLPDEARGMVGDLSRHHFNGPEYYVVLTIDNLKLAHLSQSKAFEPNKTLMEKPIFLYGKYKNKWQFFNEDKIEIPENSKFNGFKTLLVKRTINVDSVWIGPIPEKPETIRVLLRGDYSNREDLFPKYNIKQ